MRRGRAPLTALRSFEAAGRLLSFSRAADELCVSQAAISRQVRELEAWLGAPLFARLHRRVELTEDGGRLLAQMTASFDEIDRAVSAVRRFAQRQNLAVSVEPAFAALWLVPRLAEFRRLRPDIEVEIEADLRLEDFRSRRFELAVRYSSGTAPWDRTNADYLVDCLLSPVLAPALVASGLPVESPADLAHYPLLHEESRGHWARWFHAAGAPADLPTGGPLFNDGALAVQAAVRGHGVALADVLLASDDLAAGRLIRPFATALASGGYWLVASDRPARSEPAQAFATWLKGEMAKNLPGVHRPIDAA